MGFRHCRMRWNLSAIRGKVFLIRKLFFELVQLTTGGTACRRCASLFGPVLRALVAVFDSIRKRPLADRHCLCAENKLGRLHGPADDPVREHVKGDVQMHKPGLVWDVDNVVLHCAWTNGAT